MAKAKENGENMKELFIRMTDYLRQVKGIAYKDQAERINRLVAGMNWARMRNIRSNAGSPFPSQAEIDAINTEFRYELQGVTFDGNQPSPTPIDNELEQVKARLKKVEQYILEERTEYKKEKEKLLAIIERLTKT